MGRPSTFTQELGDLICERLADGESLRAICSADDMPHRATVFRWLADEDNKTFRDQYTHAREEQAETLLDEIVEIADDSRHDTIPKVGRDGEEYGEQPNSEWIARSRLRVDARKWVVSKLAPKKYGERITAEHTGPNGGPLQVVRLRMTPAEELPDE
jgi:hypothetical protein